MLDEEIRVYGKNIIWKKHECFWWKLVLEGNIDITHCNQIAHGSQFLLEVLSGWCKINFTTEINIILNEIMWNSSSIKCDN